MSRPVRRSALALVVAIGLLASLSGGEARAQDDVGDGSEITTTTRPGRSTALNQPTGQVAYVTPDRRVLVGIGDAEPKEIGTDAAIGSNGQAAVAVSPTADLVAYVRADGALVVVGAQGELPRVVATDVAVPAIGEEPVIAWEYTGNVLAYLAVGTEEQVADPGTRTRARNPETFLAPLPRGELGNVIKTVSTEGEAGTVMGDPSQRSMIGLNWSPNDPVILVDSVIPGTTDRYTLSVATGTGEEVSPTVLSFDEPDFAPDGSYVVAVGPAKGRRELVLVTLDELDRTVLATDERICNPAVSPDATRIVFGGGADCQRLMLVSSQGGRPFDITPLDAPDTATFGEPADLGWTADGRFVTYPDCQRVQGAPSCAGESKFLEPDTGRVLPGPAAVTVAPIERPLVQDVWLDIEMRGPLEFSHSFLISPDVRGALTDTDRGGILEGTLTDGPTEVEPRLTAIEGSEFVTGTVAIDDAESGIDRTFMLLGRTSLLGVRILSVSGIWISTTDLPFATGEFELRVRRR